MQTSPVGRPGYIAPPNTPKLGAVSQPLDLEALGQRLEAIASNPEAFTSKPSALTRIADGDSDEESGDHGTLPSVQGMQKLMGSMVEQEEHPVLGEARQAIKGEVQEALFQSPSPQALQERLGQIAKKHTQIIENEFGSSPLKSSLLEVLETELAIGQVALSERLDKSQQDVSVSSQLGSLSSPSSRLNPAFAHALEVIPQLPLEERQAILKNPEQLQKLLMQLELSSPPERLAATALLMEGSYEWRGPGANEFFTTILNYQDAPPPDATIQSLTSLKNMNNYSMNCWESVLTCGMLNGSLRPQTVSSFGSYANAATSTVIQKDPKDIWNDLGFFSQSCTPVQSSGFQAIPPGHLVFYVPQTPVTMGEVGSLRANKIAPKLYDLLMEKGYLVASDRQKTVVTAKCANLTGPDDITDLGIELPAPKKQALFDMLRNASGEKQYHDQLIEQHGPKGPYPAHVAISVGNGKCMSLWDRPARPDQGRASTAQVIDIARISAGNNVFAGPSPF